MSAPQPDLRCYYHPDREATSQCDRCGDYLCAQCVQEYDEQYLCAKCLRDVMRPKAPAAVKKACAAVFIGGIMVFLSIMQQAVMRLLPRWVELEEPGLWVLCTVPVFALALFWCHRANKVDSPAEGRLVHSIRMTSICQLALLLAWVAKSIDWDWPWGWQRGWRELAPGHYLYAASMIFLPMCIWMAVALARQWGRAKMFNRFLFASVISFVYVSVVIWTQWADSGTYEETIILFACLSVLGCAFLAIVQCAAVWKVWIRPWWVPVAAMLAPAMAIVAGCGYFYTTSWEGKFWRRGLLWQPAPNIWLYWVGASLFIGSFAILLWVRRRRSAQ